MKIPSGIFMLLKTLVTLEKFSQRLDSNINLAEIVLPYSLNIIKNRYSSKQFAMDLYNTVESYATLIKNLPENINEILFKLKDGEIKHDIKLKDVKLINNTIKQMTLRIAYVLLLVGLFVGSSILVVLEYETKYGLFVLYSTSILIIFLLIKWIFGKK